MSWTRLLDRLLRKLLAASRKSAAAASTDAFARLKAIADKGIIAFCNEALGFEPTKYQAKFLLDNASQPPHSGPPPKEKQAPPPRPQQRTERQRLDPGTRFNSITVNHEYKTHKGSFTVLSNPLRAFRKSCFESTGTGKPT
jgi:hypothetical protein